MGFIIHSSGVVKRDRAVRTMCVKIATVATKTTARKYSPLTL